MLKDKTVLLGVTGSIAAYKIPDLARLLIKRGCRVHVLMTKNAANFINPITFESITGNKCIIDTFDRNFQYSVEHVALAKQADAVLIAPASADAIGKIANGIADDMLTTTVMACVCKRMISPAMNHNMYHDPIVQDNISRLKGFGYEIIEPEKGMLANGDIGDGRMPESDVLLGYIMREAAYEKDLTGKRILVTAGPTREAVDPVRFITNHSTGKMGYAAAEAAMLRGADVTLVSGKTALKPPMFVKTINVVSAQEMYEAVMYEADRQDIIIMAAAVADYRPAEPSASKIKKSDKEEVIRLERTKDILKELKKREGQIICGFSMETDNLIENSKKKLISKGIDMIVANSLKTEGAGFGTDTNVITIITNDYITEYEKMSKSEAAHKILDSIISVSLR